MSELDRVKQQKWFYEFTLPDGTKTESYLPEVARQVHPTREKALRHSLGATVTAWVGFIWFQKTRKDFADVL